MKRKRDGFLRTYVWIIPLLLFSFLPANLIAQKTDVVILANGDHITGEIRKLKYGLLTFKTDDAGTPEIKWEYIDRLTSIHVFEVELIDGRQYFGSIPDPEDDRILVVQSENFRFEFNMDSVVTIMPIKNRFWKRFEGSVSLGASYSKASTVGQINYNLDVTHTTKKTLTKLTWDGNFSAQEDKDNTKRQDLNLTPNWNLGNRWFVSTQVGAEQNSEQGLDLRLYIGAGMGRNILQTNRNNLLGIAGLMTTREWDADSAVTTNLEGYFYLDYSIFKYDTPKTDFKTNIGLFPGITDWGRIRLQFNFNVSQEIVKDFTFDINFYDSYDNKPSGGGSKNDWGVTFGIGYSFNK